MKLNVAEALRYLGARQPDAALTAQVTAVARKLEEAVTPRWSYRVFDLERAGEGYALAGMSLTGRTARTMLDGCTAAAVLGCTLGAEFDRLLREAQARDMAQAVMLDACGSALVEAGCDAAQEELAGRLPGKFLTDRFSPGYGDLPLALQDGLCAALDAPRRLGLFVTPSKMLDPVKSVTAILGISDVPQPARVRGCAFCAMRERCALRREGDTCGA